MVLALIFAFALVSCSSFELDNPDDPRNYREEVYSSNSAEFSSSSNEVLSLCGSDYYNSLEQFCDTRNNKVYKFVNIGTQTWMAENLSYNLNGNKCYGEDGFVYEDDDFYVLSESEVQANCVKYGRLYNWATAMSVCPGGWHLPTNEDWNKLFRYIDGVNGIERFYYSEAAGRHLKATSGWNWNEEDNVSGNGLDTYGFAALPGGAGISSNDIYLLAGNCGYWWSTYEEDESSAYMLGMCYDSSFEYGSFEKDVFFSVRCVKD